MLTCCAIAAGVVLLSGAQVAPARKIEFSTDQKAALDQVSAYLNGLKSFKSNFVQLGPQGQLDQGEFDLEKPGKLRFAYHPPSTLLIVATGGNVWVKNGRLNTLDRYSLSNTPLGLLLDSSIDLKSNSAVVGVEQQKDAIVIQARSANTRAQGNITLTFSWPEIQLRQWMVKDNQGGTTLTALTGIQPGAVLDQALFAIPVKAPAIKKAE